MPQLRQERSGSDGACPDASTILAVIDGDADEWLRNAYAQHLAHCSACLDLDSRLRNFDRPVLADETEWKRTEKRLDNWLGAFVESRAAAPPAMEKRAARAGFWESIWRLGLAWKLSLAMGLVALVAVGTGVYTKWRLPSWPGQSKVATSAAPAEEPSSITLPAENPHPKSEAPKSTQPETPGPTAPLIPGGVIYRPGPMAAAPSPPQVKAPPKPEESATVAERARPSEPRQQAALEPPPLPGGVMYRPGPMAAAPKPPQVKAPPKPEETTTVAEKANPSEPQQQAALELLPTTPAARVPEHAASPEGRVTAGPAPEAAHDSQAVQGQPSQAPSDVLTNRDVVNMARAKLGDAIILSKIKTSGGNFDTSVDGMLELNKAGVSKAVIQAMRDSQEIAMAAAPEPAPPSEAPPAAAPGTVSFSVRHPHPCFACLTAAESYSSGTLSISPDGTVAYDCAQTNDLSGRCEHVSFAPGSLKAVKVGPDGKLRLASKTQGNFDLYGNPEDMKQIQAAIAPLIDPALRKRFSREDEMQASAASRSAGADTSASPHSSAPTLPARPAVSTSTAETQPSETAKAPGSAPTPRAVTPNLLSSLHLASGTRLWITLGSVSRQPDGTFTFSGSLLMPLKSSASSHLDRGTGVSGSGTEAQGRTSLVVSEIVIDGSHYKLKSRAGAGSARSAGSGGVVSFDSGKVLEMWLSSDSTYERAAAAESPRQ